MGCGSCGQRYVRRAQTVVSSGPRPRIGIKKAMKPVVQPQPMQADVVSDVRTGTVDPSTGIKVETIKTGEIPGPTISNPVQESVTFKEIPGKGPGAEDA